jgi:hypothetical protein
LGWQGADGFKPSIDRGAHTAPPPTTSQPPDRSQALDDANSERLEEIRTEWNRLLAETEARNRKKLDILEKYVFTMYYF